MIKPLDIQNVSFRADLNTKTSSNTASSPDAPAPAKDVKADEVAINKEKTSPMEKVKKARTGFLDFLKGINKFSHTTTGAITGAAGGVVAASVVGLLGKNIKQAKGQIFATAEGIIKDSAKAVWNVVKFVPSLLTKAPVENVKNVVTLPIKFYKNYLKGNKLTGALATLAGLGVLAFGVVRGMFKANIENSDIDHATSSGHAKK